MSFQTEFEPTAGARKREMGVRLDWSMALPNVEGLPGEGMVYLPPRLQHLQALRALREGVLTSMEVSNSHVMPYISDLCFLVFSCSKNGITWLGSNDNL